MNKSTTVCPACGAPLAPRKARGRPAIFCGPVCRRFSEVRIQGLAARLDENERALRDLRVRVEVLPELAEEADDRRRRIRAHQSWIKHDRAELKKLLGANKNRGDDDE